MKRLITIACLCAVNALAGPTNVHWRSASGVTSFADVLERPVYANAVCWITTPKDPATYATWTAEDGSTARNNGKQGTADNRPAWVSGYTNGNGCLRFDGINDEVILSVPTKTSAGTVVGWVRPVTNFTVGELLCVAGTNDPGTYLRTDVGTGISILTRTDSGTTDQVTTPTGVVSYGAWNHVAYIGNGSAYTLMINGVTQALTVVSGSNSGRWLSGLTTLHVARLGVIRRDTAVYYFAGDIDGFGYFNRALTVAEIAAIYNREKGAHP